MMEYIDLFDAYTRGQMNPKARQAFEQRLIDDLDFKESFNQNNDTIQAVAIFRHHQLKERLAGLFKDL